MYVTNCKEKGNKKIRRYSILDIEYLILKALTVKRRKFIF